MLVTGKGIKHFVFKHQVPQKADAICSSCRHAVKNTALVSTLTSLKLNTYTSRVFKTYALHDRAPWEVERNKHLRGVFMTTLTNPDLHLHFPDILLPLGN